MFDDLTGWVTTVVETLGFVGVAALVALESVFPPIPSELVLPLAGYVAEREGRSVAAMIGAATVGSVVGALVLYWISAAIGPDRMRTIVVRHGRWLGVKEADLDRAEQRFDRHADVAVLVCRCVPLLRSIVSIPAGFRRMSLPRFIVLSAIGSAVWNTALIGAGALLGNRWERVGEVMGAVQWVVIAALVVAVGWVVVRRRATAR